jgi:hypothetical protein
VKIDDALGARLAAHASRVVEADPDRHAPPAVSDIGQVKPERLARAKPSVEHKADHRQVATAM